MICTFSYYAIQNGSTVMYISKHISDDHDLERVFRLPATTYIGGTDAALPLKEIIRRLEASILLQ